MNNNFKIDFSTLFNICNLLYVQEGVKPPVVQAFRDLQTHLISVSMQGNQTLVTYTKNLRHQLHCYIGSSTNLLKKGERNSNHRIALQRDGLPRVLSDFRPYLNADNANVIRCLLTTLSVTRQIPGDGVRVDLEPITLPFKGEVPSQLLKFIDEFDVGFGTDSYYLSCEWSRYHYSTKSGPNGLALASSLLDISLLYRLYPDLLENIIIASGSEEFRQKVESIKGLALYKHPTTPREEIRRLSVIKDKEGKNRVVAIFDYWSQTVLKPFHNTLMKVLSKVPQDRTFTQAPTDFAVVDSYFSYDLKNATDRFPLSIQTYVISKLVGSERSEAWSKILVSEPFSYKGSKVSYNSGQPMGAYSSWPAFALTHHLILQFCIKETGSPANSYILLGDDIVIGCSKLAKYYLSIMSSLGVQISPTKSITSKTCYEFAKRFFIDKIEVSPFPILSLVEAKSKPILIGLVLYEARRKGWTLDNSCHRIPDHRLFTRVLSTLCYNKRSIDRLVTFVDLSYLISYINDHFQFEVEPSTTLRYAMERFLTSLGFPACHSDPVPFMKDIFYPSLLEVKVDKLRKAFRRTQSINAEADVAFAALTVTLPSEVVDQTPVYDIQLSWPICLVLNDLSVKLTDALAESHMVDTSSPKLILALGEDIDLPDINKYSSLRRYDLTINATSSLFYNLFRQWTCRS